jgi:hypothetical protein
MFDLLGVSVPRVVSGSTGCNSPMVLTSYFLPRGWKIVEDRPGMSTNHWARLTERAERWRHFMQVANLVFWLGMIVLLVAVSAVVFL